MQNLQRVRRYQRELEDAEGNNSFGLMGRRY